MFDIGFFELLVIAVVGLVVIGPERLPGAIRSGAMWWGRIKRSIRETRSELERQLGADEIRRELHNEEVMRSLEALRRSQKELEREVKEATDSVPIESSPSTAADAATPAEHPLPEPVASDNANTDPQSTEPPAPGSRENNRSESANSRPQATSAQEPEASEHKKDV